MFAGSTRENFEGLETWDVSHVINMYGIFANATCLNHDISNWNVSRVENMGEMFDDCDNLTAYPRWYRAWG
ncbi:DUF285 domain-containing protein [Helicobacter suis]|uniref:DUF285 domain-containing protein n=1 Tax=Helicobacter suis TaxID=104628 RepID=UPI001F215262|nr:DUF285 domain-containing protein [Helicobacter suis]